MEAWRSVSFQVDGDGLAGRSRAEYRFRSMPVPSTLGRAEARRVCSLRMKGENWGDRRVGIEGWRLVGGEVVISQRMRSLGPCERDMLGGSWIAKSRAWYKQIFWKVSCCNRRSSDTTWYEIYSCSVPSWTYTYISISEPHLV